MCMGVPANLTEKIENTRITYPEKKHGVTVAGAPFVCNFTSSVSPGAFCETVTTVDDPWRMIGIKTPISDDDYWKVVGNLLHIENDTVVDASQISFEVAPDWMRIYVKKNCSAERVTKFIKTVDSEFGVSVTFAGEKTQCK